MMLAWFDETVTKPPLQLELKLGEHVVYFKMFNPSPVIVLPVYLSQGTSDGYAFEAVLEICPPIPMALSI